MHFPDSYISAEVSADGFVSVPEEVLKLLKLSSGDLIRLTTRNGVVTIQNSNTAPQRVEFVTSFESPKILDRLQTATFLSTREAANVSSY